MHTIHNTTIHGMTQNLQTIFNNSKELKYFASMAYIVYDATIIYLIQRLTLFTFFAFLWFSFKFVQNIHVKVLYNFLMVLKRNLRPKCLSFFLTFLK